MDAYLKPTAFFDYDKPEVPAWIDQQLEGVPDHRGEQSKALYDAVGDIISYAPYRFSADPIPFGASDALQGSESYCIPRAVLLGAASRSIRIPARLGLADVRDHLSSPKLIE